MGARRQRVGGRRVRAELPAGHRRGRSAHRLAPLRHEPRTPAQLADSTPDWSPDSSRIAFTHSGLGLPPEIQTIARDGSDRRDLAEGAFPAWSPDGTALAFARNGAVWTAAPNGDAQRRIAWTRSIDASRPRWLTAPQSSALGSIGNCDIDASENDAEYRGGDGIDTFLVTSVNIGAFGYGGDDLFWTGHAAQTGHADLDGGPGNDDFELYGGANTVRGGTGNDRIDVFDAVGQRLFGGAGNDMIVGGSASDVILGGPGRDRLFGGPGNDRIYASDGMQDVVHCGPGRDSVHADRRDAVARDCEHVFRSR